MQMPTMAAMKPPRRMFCVSRQLARSSCRAQASTHNVLREQRGQVASCADRVRRDVGAVVTRKSRATTKVHFGGNLPKLYGITISKLLREQIEWKNSPVR